MAFSLGLLGEEETGNGTGKGMWERGGKRQESKRRGSGYHWRGKRGQWVYDITEREVKGFMISRSVEVLRVFRGFVA